MEISLLTVLTVGFFLGLKHAIEPDHVIAVSTIASHSKKLWRSSLAGVFWGIGHTTTLFIIGMLLILLKGQIQEIWAKSFEFIVGIMLVYLGMTTFHFFRRKKIHIHEHEHDNFLHRHLHSHENRQSHNHMHSAIRRPWRLWPHRNVSYQKSMTIGFVHGLAGSAAMVLLTLSTVTSVWQGALYILVFGFGTVIGMLIVTTVIGIPFVWSVNRININQAMTRTMGVISVAYGFYYMYDLGVKDGLFKLWMQ